MYNDLANCQRTDCAILTNLDLPSQTRTRKAGENQASLAYLLVLISHGISVGDN